MTAYRIFDVMYWLKYYVFLISILITGIECAPSGHIVVNAFQQTSDTSIYAVGDAVLTADGVCLLLQCCLIGCF